MLKTTLGDFYGSFSLVKYDLHASPTQSTWTSYLLRATQQVSSVSRASAPQEFVAKSVRGGGPGPGTEEMMVLKKTGPPSLPEVTQYRIDADK